MRHGDQVPEEEHVVPYCSPGQVPLSEDGERRIAPHAFELGKDESDRSVHHWEHVPETVADDEVMWRIRAEADGTGPDPVYERRPNGRYAQMKVGSIHSIGYGLVVKKLDGDYPSHCGICGLDKIAEEDQLDVCDQLLDTIEKVFLAVTNEQPRKRPRPK